LSGSTSISRDARLEILAGTVVKVAQNTSITVDGEFIAIGTEQSPVHITDLRDDSVGEIRIEMPKPQRRIEAGGIQ
jgi:hypothetical protein